MTKSNVDFYFWLGEDGELIPLDENEFKEAIETEKETNRRWREVDVGDTTTDSPEAQAKGAFKMDAGKPGIYQGLFKRFPRALWGVAEISTFGKNKYGTWDGWENVEDALNRYKDAEGRHLLKEAMGENMDADSKMLHLKHKAWGALATLELYLRETENNATAAQAEPAN